MNNITTLLDNLYRAGDVLSHFEGDREKLIDLFVDELTRLSVSIDYETKNTGAHALSFLEDGTSDIKETMNESILNDNSLQLKALIVDVYNMLSHCMQIITYKYNRNDFKRALMQLRGMKKGAIQSVIRHCYKGVNIAYGLSQDENHKDLFVVDVPGCGQVAWHLGENHGLKCQEYPYNREAKKAFKTNMEMLRQDFKPSEIATMSEHYKIVIDSQSEDEMCNRLTALNNRENGILEDLASLVEENPTLYPEISKGPDRKIREHQI